MDDESKQAQPMPADDTTDATLSSQSSSSASVSASYTARISRTCVYPPTIIRIRDPDDSTSPTSLFQFSLHTVPLTLKRELHTILPTLTTLNPSHPLLVLSTFQHSTAHLTTFTTQTEAEKQRLLVTFSTFALSLCNHLTSRGYFADYIDPCTGHPALSARGGAVYSEVDGASALLRYRVEQAGSCAIVLHPVWGSACYPASCVTNARVEAVLEGLDRVRRRWEVRERDEQKQTGGGDRGGGEEGRVEEKETSIEGQTGNAQQSGSAGNDSSQQQQRQQKQAEYEDCGKFCQEEKVQSAQNAEPCIISVSPSSFDATR